jgi:hypothetical protein
VARGEDKFRPVADIAWCRKRILKPLEAAVRVAATGRQYNIRQQGVRTSLAQPHAGLRVRPAYRVVAHHRRPSLAYAGGLARAWARQPDRTRPPRRGARAQVRPQAREAAHGHRKSTLDSHHRPPSGRVIEMPDSHHRPPSGRVIEMPSMRARSLSTRPVLLEHRTLCQPGTKL